MTLIGRNQSTQETFPVDVETNVAYVFVRHFVLKRGDRALSPDIVITLGYDVGAEEPPTCIALLAVIGATITDPITHTDLRPRVYDEWGPVPWAARPSSIRIAAPLSLQFWDAPTAADVDLRVTVWRDPTSASS